MLSFFVITCILSSLIQISSKTISLVSDNSLFIPIETFYFPSTGGIITIDSIDVPSSSAASFAIILMQTDTFISIESKLEVHSEPILAHELLSHLSDFSDFIKVQKNKISKTRIEAFPSQTSEYIICVVQSLETPITVSFQITSAYFTKSTPQSVYQSLTPLQQSSLKRYLSYERVPQIYIDFIFFIFFTSLLYFYLKYCFLNKKHILPIHHIITISLLSKTLLLLTDSFYLSYINRNSHSSFISFFYYIISLTKTFTLFLLVILLGSGWSYMKSVLTRNNKFILFTVLTIQVLLNLSFIITQELNFSFEVKIGLQHFIFIADVVCFFLSVIPLQNTINELKKSCHMDGKAVYNIARIKQFVQFYSLIMLFIYATRFIKYILILVLPKGLSWVVFVWKDAADLGLYWVIVRLFGPKKFVVGRKVLRDLEDVEMEEVGEEDLREIKEMLKEKSGKLEL